MIIKYDFKRMIRLIVFVLFISGPLAVIAFAFVACKNWAEQGWELEDNPVATAFEIFWMFFEPMLFSVTGAQVVVSITSCCYMKTNKQLFSYLIGSKQIT